jgi:metallophosphoesterase (TIGR03767 family)
MTRTADATSSPLLSTLDATVVPSTRDQRGYRLLAFGNGEPITVRNDLGGGRIGGRLQPLVSFAQITDLHICDTQSPARAEFLDRLGDPDSDVAMTLGMNRTYRAQEALTHHVLEAMTHALRRAPGGALTGAPIEFVISTGDAIDNAQSNELDNYIALLDGGEVQPDSGASQAHQGIGDPSFYDPRYWHPDGTPLLGAIDDFPRARHGFPTVPGLNDAWRKPFRAVGVGLPWYAVYGNHDALCGGILRPDEQLRAFATGAIKVTGVERVRELARVIGLEVGNDETIDWMTYVTNAMPVEADPGRIQIDRRSWIAAHLASLGAPRGHGYAETSLADNTAYYAFDAGEIRFLVLDTVNTAGGYQGSIDGAQFAWLERELVAGHRSFSDERGITLRHNGSDRLFVIVSHHRLEDLTNHYAPDGVRRHLADDVRALLARFANVICWIDGHSHIHAIGARRAAPLSSGAGFWELTTGSHIDWPQQSRVIEIARDEFGQIVIATTTLDHSGLIDPRIGTLDDPLTLAGWSRELAANAWQSRANGHEPSGRGTVADRNVALVLGPPTES